MNFTHISLTTILVKENVDTDYRQEHLSQEAVEAGDAFPSLYIKRGANTDLKKLCK